MRDHRAKETEIERRIGSFTMGDNVQIVGASEEESDTGVVVAFTFGGVRVLWTKAGEVYTHSPSELLLVKVQP